MPLTDEEKLERKIERMTGTLRGKGHVNGKAKNYVAKSLQKAIRMEYADDNGNVKCVSCDKWMKWNRGCEAGHYVPGRGWGVIFDERNIHPQCTHCNNYLSGNRSEYKKYMLFHYGEAVVEELESNKNKGEKIPFEDLARMLIKYNERIRKQEKRLGVK